MNGDVGEDAPRPRPLSAGIWTLFSWLRRTDRSSSSESVTSVGSDRTVASFDFLAPLNYKHASTPLVLSQGPLTDSYKKRVHERNLRRQHDRDLTLRRKYGLFREEGLGYDAFTLPSARKLQKDTVNKQDRERRATSESIQRRSAYVPGKRRAPLPPTVIVSATLPRYYKRKRPAPKPPVKIFEENKENLEINKIIQMKSTSDTYKQPFLSKDASSENKTEKHSKHDTKEIKLRTDKGFLKQIFDNKKRNSAVDTSRVKLLPSISELDKQAAEIIEAKKSLRAFEEQNINYDNESKLASYAEETWMCTTCLRKYKPVVKCCIYCVIKENSSNNIKNVKKVSANALNTCTQTDQDVVKSNRKNVIEDKKKLREMLKEMKDSLPKRPKHSDKSSEENRSDAITSIETPTLRIGSNIDQNIKVNVNHSNSVDSYSDRTKNAKETFLKSQPSSSKQFPINFVTDSGAVINRKSCFEPFSANINDPGNLNSDLLQNVFTPKVAVQSIKESSEINKNLSLTRNLTNKIEQTNVLSSDVKVSNKINGSADLASVNKLESASPNIGSKRNNAILNHKVSTNMIIRNSGNLPTEDVKKNTINDLKPPLNNSTKVEKEAILTEKSSKIILDDQAIVSPIKKCDGSGIKNKIELIQLGNIFSPNTVSIDQADRIVPSNNSKNIDLHTPLKISSLLNPLYCPKYKKPNDKVSDCNFAKIITTKESNLERNKSEKINERTILSNITVVAPSTSNTKVLHIDLQKQEPVAVDASKDKKNESGSTVIAIEDLKSETDQNTTSEIVKTNSMNCNKIVDIHGRRRNLINQLEQAISKGDEQLAAEAAAKLAKLKLSCSVLSFSSQIVAEAIPNETELLEEKNKNNSQTNKNFQSDIKVKSMQQPEKSLNKQDTKNQHEDQKPTTQKQINILSEATTSTPSQIVDDEIIQIEIWVEDKEAARGPIPLRISRLARIGELKRQVETSLGLKIRLQRWIVGRALCTDDNTQLVALAGPDLNVPFYVCLVESETNKDKSTQIKDYPHAQNKAVPSEVNNATSGDVYVELMKLEQQALVPNTEEFECGVCIEQCAVGAGAVLRECIHTFCRECLADVIRHCEEPVVACPAIECPGAIQDREIRALLTTEEYDRWLARGLATVESGTRNTFHCRTRDCKGWAFCEPGVRRFPCPVCKHTNCVPCQAVHENETCEEYQMKLREAVSAAESNHTEEGTQALLKSLMSRGEALECPECSAIITKKWGCDWVKCSACKTEICWVTKGRRWGPGGKGDTSGGCKCGVDGKRCHPSCGYCH